MELTEIEKRNILENVGGYAIIAGKKYYVKKALLGYEKTELIACEIAKMLDINCASYQVISIDNNNYYLSEDLREQGSFIPLGKLGINKISLTECWSVLEKSYSNVNELMLDIIKIYLFDILFMNDDRDINNIGLQTTISGPKIVMFDNEFIFSMGGVCLTSKYSRNEKSYTFDREKFKNCERYLKHNLEELAYFLDVSSQEFVNLFIDMYNKCNPLLVEEVIKKHNSENAKYFSDLYNKNYELIGGLINSRGR